MKQRILIGIVISALAAPAAWATIGDVAPANPCPGTAKYKGKGLAVLDVSGDGSVGAGCGNQVWAETVITCTSKEKVKGNPPAAVTMDDTGNGREAYATAFKFIRMMQTLKRAE